MEIQPGQTSFEIDIIYTCIHYIYIYIYIHTYIHLNTILPSYPVRISTEVGGRGEVFGFHGEVRGSPLEVAARALCGDHSEGLLQRL